MLLQTVSQSSKAISISLGGLQASTQRGLKFALVSAFESEGNECVKSFLFIASHLCVGDSAWCSNTKSLPKLQFGCSSILWLAYPTSFDVHNASHDLRVREVRQRIETPENMSQNEHLPGAAGWTSSYAYSLYARNCSYCAVYAEASKEDSV